MYPDIPPLIDRFGKMIDSKIKRGDEGHRRKFTTLYCDTFRLNRVIGSQGIPILLGE
jgi:hypothetical protein